MKFNQILLVPTLAAGLVGTIFGAVFIGSHKEELDFDFFQSKHPDIFVAAKNAIYEARVYPEAPNTIVFSKESYAAPKSENDAFLINIDKAVGLVIDGRDAVVTIDSFNSFLSISNSKDIVVKNFTVIFDRPAFTHGTASSADADGLSFVFEAGENQPALPSDIWAKKTYGDGAWGTGIAAGGKCGAPLRIMKVEELGARKYKIFTDGASGDSLKNLADATAFAAPVPVEPNDRLFAQTEAVLKFLNLGMNGENATARQAVPAVFITKSSNVRLENIRIVGAPMVGMAAFRNEGEISMDSCEIADASGPGAPSPALRAMLFADNRVGPQVSNCSFSGYFKNCIEIAATPAFIRKKTDDLNYEMSEAGLAADAPLGVYYPADGAWADTINVRSAKGSEIGLDKPISGAVTSDGGEDTAATQVFNMDYANGGFLISDCRFDTKSAGDILVRAPSGEITGNRFLNGGEDSICVGVKPGGPKIGPPPQNVRILKNDFAR